jgi:hypothetical protein
MGTLSYLLGIPHFTTSSGGSVRRDFLEAVGEGMHIPRATISAMGNKDDLLTLLIEEATQEPMDPALLSTGGTITNDALQAIVDGITRRGIAGRPNIPQVEGSEVAAEDSLTDLGFDPAAIKDERDKRLMEIAAREGQDRFRTALLDAYGDKCAVTGYDAVETLQAAHIYPYQGPATNVVSNGLLLRADIHTLYDRGAISIHETTFKVLVKPHLYATTYLYLGGNSLRLPKRKADRPSTAALRSHRLWAGM